MNQLCNLDPVLTYTLAKEVGGSWECGPTTLSMAITHGDQDGAVRVPPDGVDALLDQFDAYRASLTSNPDKD